MSNVVDFIVEEDGSGRHVRAATLERLVQFCVDEFGKILTYFLLSYDLHIIVEFNTEPISLTRIHTIDHLTVY